MTKYYSLEKGMIVDDEATLPETPQAVAFPEAKDFTPEQMRYQAGVKSAIEAGDPQSAEKLSKQFASIYGMDLFEPTPMSEEEKQAAKNIEYLQKSPIKSVTTDPGFKIMGIPIKAQRKEYSYFNPITGQTETTSDYKEALASVNSILASYGAAPSTTQEVPGEVPSETPQGTTPAGPGILGAAYNLTLRPIVEGTKAYGTLLGTAAGTGAVALLAATDPNQVFTGPQQLFLAESLAPIALEKYSDPADTIINGFFQTLGGIGAAAQVWTGATLGVAKLVATNLAFNAGMYGTGGLIKAEKEKAGIKGSAVNFVNGALGFTTEGPFVAGLGDRTSTRLADLAVSLIAPVIYMQVQNRINAKVSATSLERPGGEGLIPDVKGRAATSLGVPNKQSITKSQNLMGQAVKITTSVRKRGMGMELEGMSRYVGEQIDDYIPTALDSKIDVPNNSYLGYIEKRLAESPVTKNYEGQQLAKQVLNDIQGRMPVTDPVTGGISAGLKPSGLNNIRMWLNSKISPGYFKQGQPTMSATDMTNSLMWEASAATKDFLGSLDDQINSSKYLQTAIDMQHTAKAVGPVIAMEELTGGRKIQTLTGAIQKYLKDVLYFIIEPLKVSLVRRSQGQPTATQQAILSGQIPPSIPTANALPATPPAELPPQTEFSYRTEPGFWRGRAADTSRWTIPGNTAAGMSPSSVGVQYPGYISGQAEPGSTLIRDASGNFVEATPGQVYMPSAESQALLQLERLAMKKAKSAK